MVQSVLYACIPVVLAILFIAVVWFFQTAEQHSHGSHLQRMLRHRVPLVVSLLTLLLGLLLTVRLADASGQAALADAQTHFLHEVDQLESEVQDQVSDLEHRLNGLRGLFMASDDVNHAEFRQFLSSLETHQEHPGYRGLGYIERVPHGRLPDQFVIKYLEPEARNREAIGYDIGAEPVRRNSAQAAMLSGMPALTPRISLVQDSLHRPAALYLMPFYSGQTPPGDPAERERRLRGWVYAPLVFSELMAGGSGVNSKWVDYQLFDGPGVRDQDLVYDSEVPSGDPSAAPAQSLRRSSMFTVLRPILLVDQVFYLRVRSAPAFEDSYHPEAHLHAALLGSGVSVLASMVLWLLMVGRSEALERARNMRSDLERLAMVAERTSNAVYSCNIDWQITWINEGFTRMSGFSAEEALAACRA
jgi:CHASE1-domain containing sensor protein